MRNEKRSKRGCLTTGPRAVSRFEPQGTLRGSIPAASIERPSQELVGLGRPALSCALRADVPPPLLRASPRLRLRRVRARFRPRWLTLRPLYPVPSRVTIERAISARLAADATLTPT